VRRLAEGKVYMGDRAAEAAENFFKDTHLTALRELALRFVAERVDKRLRELRGAGPLKRSGGRGKIIGGGWSSPSSLQLIRWTRRMAAAQGAPGWQSALNRLARSCLMRNAGWNRNLALARELGAEVVMTHDEDVAEALVRVAIPNTMRPTIVVGKSRQPRWLTLFSGGNLVDRVVRLSGSIDVYVVPAERAADNASSRLGMVAVRAVVRG